MMKRLLLTLYFRIVPRRAGRYLVEYSLPPAAHFGLYESELELTGKEAKIFTLACYAETVFWSSYTDRKWNKVARKLGEKLKAADPRYAYPIGVIVSCKRIAAIAKAEGGAA